MITNLTLINKYIVIHSYYINVLKSFILLIVVAESSVEEVGPNPEPVIQSVSSSSHASGTSVTNDGGGTTVGGT